MFFKINVLKNFARFTKKEPVLESLFNKVTSLQTYNFIKMRLQQRCFSGENREIFKNTYIYKTPPVAASKLLLAHFMSLVFLDTP